MPKIHDIGLLQEKTEKFEPSVKLDEKVADKITSFAAESRYPDRVVDFTNDDAKFALKHAKQALDQVKQVLNIVPNNEQHQTPGQ